MGRFELTRVDILRSNNLTSRTPAIVRAEGRTADDARVIGLPVAYEVVTGALAFEAATGRPDLAFVAPCDERANVPVARAATLAAQLPPFLATTNFTWEQPPGTGFRIGPPGVVDAGQPISKCRGPAAPPVFTCACTIGHGANASRATLVLAMLAVLGRRPRRHRRAA